MAGMCPAWSSRAGKEKNMTLIDPLGDMLTRIRNAQMRSRETTHTPASKLRGNVLDVLKSEGYIRGYSESTLNNGISEFQIELKYSNSSPVIQEIQRVSRPGRRVYASVKNIPQVAKGLGVSILSTPKGVMADHEARSNNVGGEVLCRVF